MLRLLHLVSVVLVLGCAAFTAQAAEVGYRKSVLVSAETRIDWMFCVANQSPPKIPEGWLAGYRSTDQKYECFVPEKYTAEKAWPVVIFISPSDQPTGFAPWKTVCEQKGVLFASPFGAGNNCESKKRIRIVLDVLDDLRRHYHLDPERTYIGGFSGGGRIACGIAFSLPEYFGGVIPVCAAGDLREESWLRRRVQVRLSVAHVTGENDFNRGEVERFRGPLLAEVGVRAKVWVPPGVGHSLPDSKVLLEAYQWLEAGVGDRRKLTRQFPASSVGSQATLSREEQCAQLNAEAKELLAVPASKYAGLMLLKGILDRWPDLPEAAGAKKTLLAAEQANDQAWQADDIAEQRKFLIARARGLSEYALGPLPAQYVGQKRAMVAAASELWRQVIEDGQNKSAVAEGQKYLEKLQATSDRK